MLVLLINDAEVQFVLLEEANATPGSFLCLLCLTCVLQQAGLSVWSRTVRVPLAHCSRTLSWAVGRSTALVVPGRLLYSIRWGPQPVLALTASDPTELGWNRKWKPTGIHLPHLEKEKKRKKKAINLFLLFNADIVADKNKWFMFYSYIYWYPAGIPTSLGCLASFSSLRVPDSIGCSLSFFWEAERGGENYLY